jgi:phosphoglucosamine mutase
LGAEVIEFAAQPDGLNINADCGATSMDNISALVVEHDADLGIALDGDGDRLMLVDHTGYVVDGDEAIYIIASHELRRGMLKGGVVGTLMSNMGLELALAELGIAFARSKVGDRYVMEMLKKKGWRLGAENSGHIINLKHNTTGDGIVAALNILTAMASAKQSLFELRQGMKKLPQVLLNVRYSDGQEPLSDPRVTNVVSEVEQTLTGRGRVLMRKSGTEPLIRVMVEGPQETEVVALAEKIAEVVRLAC